LTDTLNIAPADVIWLAALLEGEGALDVSKGKYPRVRVSMVDRDVITRAAQLMGCRVRLSLHGQPAQPSWHAEVTGTRASAIMRAILPYMGNRRSQQIAKALATEAFRPVQNRSSLPGPQLETTDEL
jgi:hypothetical protein